MSEERINTTIKSVKKASAAVRKAQRTLEQADSYVPWNQVTNYPQLVRALRSLREQVAYVEGYVNREHPQKNDAS